MGDLSTYHLIIIFSATIIISYFFNIYSKKSGIPAVLMLITFGVVISGGLSLFKVAVPDLSGVLEVLGIVGLILIVLEAALDLKLLKEKIGIIIKSLFVSIIGLGLTSYISAYLLSYFIDDLEFVNALLYSIPLSILSSAIILPSIDSLEENKREFMIYESTFSDIVGIIGFYAIVTMIDSQSSESILPDTFKSLLFTIVLSVIISYVLIYIFQNLKGHAKLFLLIAVLLLLYSIGKMFHLSSLIIIMVFGVILNNYKLFFRGVLNDFIIEEKVGEILSNFKVITMESAFVVRTFFFIIFGWTISLGDLLSFRVLFYGLILLAVIYFVRMLVLFVFNGTFRILKVTPELFLAPRGLITILLFFSIPESVKSSFNFDGVLLFVILTTCLIMTWSLVGEKKRLKRQEEEDFEILETDEVLEEEN
ncbi:MAG: sodium:proton exchanger [Flavobacteriales bacterium]|nr:sodium:proton exchanger [Flavobacteriales bacterium]